jgi:sigma-B regulation protein RsbU (phosphoserine phosphatase)
MKRTSWGEADLYKAAIFLLVLIMLSIILLGEPNEMIRIIASMKRAIMGQITGTELAWIVILFGALSIYGSLRGIAFEGYLINIRDLGAIMAGVVGGPLAGVIAVPLAAS